MTNHSDVTLTVHVLKGEMAAAGARAECLTLLFYKYVRIADPAAAAAEQEAMCRRLGLKGRIRVASEGINGSVAGEEGAADAYVREMEAHALFGGIDWKRSSGPRDGRCAFRARHAAARARRPPPAARRGRQRAQHADA